MNIDTILDDLLRNSQKLRNSQTVANPQRPMNKGFSQDSQDSQGTAEILNFPSVRVTVTCSECRHAVATAHPKLIKCAAGVQAPGAGGLWWLDDRHVCDERAPDDR